MVLGITLHTFDLVGAALCGGSRHFLIKISCCLQSIFIFGPYHPLSIEESTGFRNYSFSRFTPVRE